MPSTLKLELILLLDNLAVIGKIIFILLWHGVSLSCLVQDLFDSESDAYCRRLYYHRVAAIVLNFGPPRFLISWR